MSELQCLWIRKDPNYKAHKQKDQIKKFVMIRSHL